MVEVNNDSKIESLLEDIEKKAIEFAKEFNWDSHYPYLSGVYKSCLESVLRENYQLRESIEKLSQIKRENIF